MTQKPMRASIVTKSTGLEVPNGEKCANLLAEIFVIIIKFYIFFWKFFSWCNSLVKYELEFAACGRTYILEDYYEEACSFRIGSIFCSKLEEKSYITLSKFFNYF